MNEIAAGTAVFAEREAESSPEEQETTRRRKPQRAEERLRQQDEVGEALRKRFVIAGAKYYYRDREETVAFEDRGTRLTTEWQDPNVIHGMMLRAREKGWSSLHIKGTEAFKAEAWLQAKIAGFEVAGYQPRALDEAKLADRLKDERRPSTDDREGSQTHENVIEKQASHQRRERPFTEKQQVALKTLEAILLERGDSPTMREAVLAEAKARLRGDRIIVGQVREHGIAHFEHNPDKEKSYYVKLDTAQGVKEVWGTDLARALENSDITTGDRVALVQKRKEPVVVQVAVRDQQGRVTETTPRTVSRNVWDVVNLDRLGERERNETVRTVEKDPVVPIYDRAGARQQSDPVRVATKRREREREER
jgi:putative DNA primase/helicase